MNKRLVETESFQRSKDLFSTRPQTELIATALIRLKHVLYERNRVFLPWNISLNPSKIYKTSISLGVLYYLFLFKSTKDTLGGYSNL